MINRFLKNNYWLLWKNVRNIIQLYREIASLKTQRKAGLPIKWSPNDLRYINFWTSDICLKLSQPSRLSWKGKSKVSTARRALKKKITAVLQLRILSLRRTSSYIMNEPRTRQNERNILQVWPCHLQDVVVKKPVTEAITQSLKSYFSDLMLCSLKAKFFPMIDGLIFLFSVIFTL